MQYESLIWKPALLSTYDEGIPRPWYQQVKVWFGLYTIIWVCIYWRFW